MNRDDLLEKYASNLPDDRYRNHYVSYARNFLDSAAALDKESINKHQISMLSAISWANAIIIGQMMSNT